MLRARLMQRVLLRDRNAADRIAIEHANRRVLNIARYSMASGFTLPKLPNSAVLIVPSRFFFSVGRVR